MSDAAPSHVACGACFDVALTASVGRSFEKLEPRTRARLKAWMEKLAQHGIDSVVPDTLKWETRAKIGKHHVAVYAMREGTVRLYGGIVPRAGLTRMFLMTEFEDKKRGKGKADPERLNRAARYLVASFA